jgi:ligand-binding sensor domain-containing protein
VYAVVQSNDGYLWLGSDAGLMRFDGWRFFTWDDLSDTPIPGSVKSLAVARAGGLWAGLSNPAAVARVQDGKAHMLTAGLEGLDAVTSLIEDAAGVAWAIADWELYSWRAGRWHKAELPWPTRPGQVRHVFASRSGALWVGTRWGVFEQRDASRGFQFVSPEHVWGIGEDPAGRIWTTDVAAGFRQLGAKTRPRRSCSAPGVGCESDPVRPHSHRRKG